MTQPSSAPAAASYMDAVRTAHHLDYVRAGEVRPGDIVTCLLRCCAQRVDARQSDTLTVTLKLSGAGHGTDPTRPAVRTMALGAGLWVARSHAN